MASHFFGLTLAESLFLRHAGAASLPQLYVLLAIVSIPVSLALSSIVDRVSRPVLIRRLLVAASGAVLVLAAVIRLHSSGYFLLYVVTNVTQLVADALFWILVADYFTSIELKRLATILVLSMGIGGALGGSLAGLLSTRWTAERQLLALPLLFALAILQVSWLDRNERPLGESDSTDDAGVGVLATLRLLPALFRRSPIVLVIAVQLLLAAILQRATEYAVFSIYGARYASEQALTGFLGRLGATLSLVEMGVTLIVTRPLIQRLGVGRMNLLHPATTLVSLAALAARPSLAVAIAANLNSEGLLNSIAQPVVTLDYNAVPRRFLGRVRLLNDAVVVPLGLGIAGVLLWIASQHHAGPREISLVAAVISVAYLIVGHAGGRGYITSLLDMLRSRSVDLEDVSGGLGRLPARYAEEVRRLLASDEPNVRRLGLELATRMDPTPFLADLEPLLTNVDASIRRSLVRLYASLHREPARSRVRAMLRHASPAAREVALEAIVASRQMLPEDELRRLLVDETPAVRALACVAAVQAGDLSPSVATAAREVFDAALDRASCREMIRAIRGADDPRLNPLLKRLTSLPDTEVKRDGLEALASLAAPGDLEAQAIASAALDDSDPAMRAAAVEVIGRVADRAQLDRVAGLLADDHYVVRSAAAEAVAAYGEVAIVPASTFLASARPEVARAAISALGRIRTRRAEDALFDSMRSDYRRLAVHLEWLEEITSSDGDCLPLIAAIEDSNQRVIRRVFAVLESLGYERVLSCVRQILRAADRRARDDAIETLASLAHHRFVDPVLPLLTRAGEAAAGRGAWRRRIRSVHPGDQQIIRDALRSDDRWIQLAAEMAMHSSVAAGGAPNPFSPMTTQAWHEGSMMNRMLFLKTIPLLKVFSLDELLVIDGLLTSKEFLRDESIFREGSIGGEFYIIQRGTVAIQKRFGESERELARLSASECFGEMALFDDAPRSASAVAASDATLLALERSRFSSLLMQRPEMALEVCRVLSWRLRDANEKLGDSAS